MSYIIGRGRYRGETYGQTPRPLYPSTTPPLQPNTWVDPSNVSGNANDDGPGTASEPLLTVAEYNRRAAQTLLDFAGTTTFLSDILPDSDPLTLANFHLAVGGTMVFLGTPITQQAPSTFTNVVSLSPTAPTYVDDAVNSIAQWQGLFVTDTTNPFGLSAVVDLQDTPTAAYVSWDLDSFAIRDSYIVERGSGLCLGDCRWQGNPEFVGGASQAPFQFYGFSFVRSNAQAIATFPANTTGTNTVTFQNCLFFQELDPGSTEMNLTGCSLGVDDTKESVPGGTLLGSGNATITFTYGVWGSIQNSLYPTPTSACAIVLTGFTSLQVYGTTVSIGQSSASANIQQCGSLNLQLAMMFRGVTAPPGGPLLDVQAPNALTIGAVLWGSQNTGTGVLVERNASAIVNNPPLVTMEPGSVDFAVGGVNVQARAWDETANAGAGGYTTPIACTWTNFATAIAGGGFNGAAFNPGQNAAIVGLPGV